MAVVPSVSHIGVVVDYKSTTQLLSYIKRNVANSRIDFYVSNPPGLHFLKKNILSKRIINKFTQYSVTDKLKEETEIYTTETDDRVPDTFTTDRLTRMSNSNTIFLTQFSKTVCHIQ